MKWLTAIIAFYTIFVGISAEKARFDFYRVYEVQIENENHLKLMKEISAYPDGVSYSKLKFFNVMSN